MIKCPNCGKENQDHYKFCLGCGGELPRGAVKPSVPSTTPTPPSGLPAAPKIGEPVKVDFSAPPSAKPQPPVQPKPPLEPLEPRAEQPAPAKEPPGKAQKCPVCGANVPPDFAFCGKCGTRLSQIPSAVAPKTAAKPAPPAVEARVEAVVRGKIVMIQPDGSEGISVPIVESGTCIGRNTGEAFKEDYFLSPDHARFVIEGDTLFVEDENSLNGIYIRLAPETPYELNPGDYIRIGQEVIEFETLQPQSAGGDTPILGSPINDCWGKISLVLGKNRYGNRFTLKGKEVLIGREKGNIIFPDDGYVSGLHLKISRENGKFYITDLKSSNGTYLKIREKKEIKGGDYLLIGQFLYRVDF